MQGEREEQYQKGHGRILQDTTLLAGTLYFCNREAKITVPSPERLFVHTRFLSKVLLYSQLLVRCSHGLLACFIAFQLPGALPGEARQMRQRRILAGRIPGAAEESVPAAGDALAARWPHGRAASGAVLLPACVQHRFVSLQAGLCLLG